MCTIPIVYVAFNLLYAAVADEALAEKGRVELQKLRQFAGETRYGACWSRALERVHASCRDFSEDTQSMMAVAFTHCHLRRSELTHTQCFVWVCCCSHEAGFTALTWMLSLIPFGQSEALQA